MEYFEYKFDLARNSLKYVIKTFEIKEIYIPYYLCDVIRHSIIEVGCKPIFYHIDDNFFPTQNFNKDASILYPNYFGICENNIDILTEKYPNLIVDNAHSYYSNPKGIACFNAWHKFFDMKGSSLWIKKMGADLKHPKDVQKQPPKTGDNGKSRLMKFRNYHEKYSEDNSLEIDINSCISPFCYPYLAKNTLEADNLVKELNKEGLTIYRYWNTLPQNYNEYKFYSRLVPIPLN
ncbi:MAG: hypothetical protein MJ231_04530 [bacterium]|nr:hypothetical protein [bacterium]